VGYSAEDSFAQWNTIEEKQFQCGIQWEKTSALLDTTEENLSGNILKLFCGSVVSTLEKISSTVSHNRGKPLPSYPTPEKKLET
jgi:hypothetical protein